MSSPTYRLRLLTRQGVAYWTTDRSFATWQSAAREGMLAHGWVEVELSGVSGTALLRVAEVVSISNELLDG